MSLGPFGLSKNGSAADLSITTAREVICTPITGLVGMQAFSASLELLYQSGGESVKAYIQTSLDQGNTWIDIACCTFQIAYKRVVLNFSGLTPKTTETVPTDGSMTDDTAMDGILGDQVRLKVKSTGTYDAGTLLKARMVAR